MPVAKLGMEDTIAVIALTHYKLIGCFQTFSGDVALIEFNSSKVSVPK